jgi:hypothetical protein
MPDLLTVRSVLLELAGYDALPVSMTVREGDKDHAVTGSPVQCMNRLDEFTDDAQVRTFSFELTG